MMKDKPRVPKLGSRERNAQPRMKGAPNKISDAQFARLEKSLRDAASLGSALAILGREILKEVKSAELAIDAYRKFVLSLPMPTEPVADSRSKRYEENTKKLLDAFEGNNERTSPKKPARAKKPTASKVAHG